MGLVGYVGLLSVLGLLNFVGASLSTGLILLGIAHAFFIIWTVLCLFCAFADIPKVPSSQSPSQSLSQSRHLGIPEKTPTNDDSLAKPKPKPKPKRIRRANSACSERINSGSLVQKPAEKEKGRQRNLIFLMASSDSPPSPPGWPMTPMSHGSSASRRPSIFFLPPPSGNSVLQTTARLKLQKKDQRANSSRRSSVV